MKVCGLSQPVNVAAIAQLQPDYMGFIFYGPSPRAVAEDFRLPVEATVPRVGVFVDASLEEVQNKINKYNLAAVQLHGAESPAYCAHLRAKNANCKIFKAFHIAGAKDFDNLSQYAAVTDAWVLDAKGENYGGNGLPFDWSLLSPKIRHPFLLSGGITETDAEAILAIEHPHLWGVDINSRFEDSPGIKNPQSVRKFIQTIRNHGAKG